jgi:UDP-glucuronate 4-epimerase
MKKILLTGAAGFIGSNTASALLRRGDTVVGVDNLNDYYDPARKHARSSVCLRSTALTRSSTSLRWQGSVRRSRTRSSTST